MDNKKSNNFFWPSYVDLMTSLFAITLVLFVISYITLKRERDKFEVMAKEYAKILRIQKQVKQLESKGFTYDSTYQRYLVQELTGQEIFMPKMSVIKSDFVGPALKAGKNIKELLESFENDDKTRFLILVEGNTANTIPKTYPEHSDYGYKLSFERALALVSLWRENGIIFDSKKAEIVISGSGFSGVGREEGINERNNKRFLIQIIPKIDK